MDYIFSPRVYAAMMRRKSLARSLEESGGNENVDGGAENSKSGGNGLVRSLNLSDVLFYGVGCSVGAGIYCLVGIGAEIAGPGIALSFLSCGIACIFTALSYAEFAARIPVTGSAYTYAYVAFGEFWAWLVGWNLTLGYAFSAAVVARSWAEYLANFIRGLFGDHGPDGGGLIWLTRMPIRLPFLMGGEFTCSPLSTVIIGFCTLVLVTGAKESSRFNNAMTVLNLSILGFVIISGIGTDTIDSENLTPFIPHGIQGVSRGAGFVFFAFIGFDMVACLSEEVVNPEKNMPRGIVGSLIISTAIYVSVSLVVIGMAPVALLGGDVPITNALLANACCTHEQQLAHDAAGQCLIESCAPLIHRVLLHGSHLISFGAIFGLTTGTFTSLMGQPRIFYRMAQDGLLFKFFGKVNETTHVPTAGIIVTGLLVALLACLVELDLLASLISIGTLQVFTFVDAGVILLRMSPSLDTTIIVSTHDQFLDNSTTHESRSTSFWSASISRIRFKRGGRRTVLQNGSKPVYYTLAFTISILLFSLAISNDWHTLWVWVFAALALVTFFLVCQLPTSAPPRTFSCPWVPVVPLMGIGCNAYMMGSIPFSAWLMAIVWSSLGLMVYFLYGIHNSTLGKVISSGDPMEEATPESSFKHECDPLIGTHVDEPSYESTLNVSLHQLHQL